MAKNVLIRCDASQTIGTGHFLRCSQVADQLSSLGYDVIFLTCNNEYTRSLSNNQLHRYLYLPIHTPVPESDTHTPALSSSSSWIDSAQLDDASDSLNLLLDNNIVDCHWLILDHYSLDNIWIRCFKNLYFNHFTSLPKVLYIDDLLDQSISVDLLVRPTTFPHILLPNGVNASFSDSVKTLCGPAYLPINPLYAQLQALTPSRHSISRILVYFGGADVQNFTLTTLKVLTQLVDSSASIDVVISSVSFNRSSIEDFVALNPSISLYFDLPCLVSHVIRADLAIGAGGTAMWERAILGLPSLVLSIAHNQKGPASSLSEYGAVELLKCTSSDFSQELVTALNKFFSYSSEYISSISNNAKAVTDGLGAARIVTAMFGPCSTPRLRPAVLSDLSLFYRWYCDPVLRDNSFTSSCVSFESHASWFHSRMINSNCLTYVLTDKYNLPLGQIRFDSVENVPSVAKISFSLDSAARGFGLSSQLLQLGFSSLIDCWGSDVTAYGLVKSSNTPSIKSFLKAGFSQHICTTSETLCFVKGFLPFSSLQDLCI